MVTADQLNHLRDTDFDRDAWPKFVVRAGAPFVYANGVAYFQCEANGTMRLMSAQMQCIEQVKWSFDEMMQEVSWARDQVSPLYLAAFLNYLQGGSNA